MARPAGLEDEDDPLGLRAAWGVDAGGLRRRPTRQQARQAEPREAREADLEELPTDNPLRMMMAESHRIDSRIGRDPPPTMPRCLIPVQRSVNIAAADVDPELVVSEPCIEPWPDGLRAR